MSFGEADAALKELPYYKTILKSLLRKQIASLIEELALETGEESVFLIADKSTGSTSCLSSSNAQHFIEAHNDIETKFLSFLNGNANVETHGIRTQRTGKRKAKNDQKNAKTPKQAKLNTLFSSAVNTADETVSESVDSAGIDSESIGAQSESVCIENEANEETRIAISNSFDGVNIKIEPLDVTIPDLTIVKNEQSHSQTEASEMNVSTDLNCQPIAPVDQNQNDSAISSPGGTQTFGPIRFVRKFPPKERTTLSLPEKIQIIQDYESGITTSQRKLANKYNISKSAVADMIKNRQLLKEHYEFNANTKRKRFNTNSKFTDINEVVWQWFRTARENGIQMSGPMIQEKALQVAQELKVTDFKGSNGWLHSWKSRYNVTSYRDDTHGGGKQNYINDYSKVEGFDANATNSVTTNAIMNLGRLSNVYNTDTSNQAATSTNLENSDSICSSEKQGSGDLSIKGSTVTDNQKSQHEVKQSEDSDKECAELDTNNRKSSVNSKGSEQTELDSSLSNMDTLAHTASYEKIVEGAVSEFEQQNSSMS